MIKFDYLIITHFLALFFLAVLTLMFILGVRYKRDYHRLKTERNTKQDEILVEKWYEKQTILSWMRWRRWTLTRYYHAVKGILLVRVISTYSYFLKAVIGITVALVAYDLADRSAVVAGATAFYASMLFFESKFIYAALWHTNIDKSRLENNDKMDAASCSVKVTNIGGSDARKVQTNMRIVDPVRDVEIELFDKDISVDDGKLSDPIKTSLSRKFQYRVTTDGDISSEIYRVRLDDHLGVKPWAVIDFQTPDALTMTRIYVPIPESENISLAVIKTGTQQTTEAFRNKKEELGIESGSSINISKNEDEENSNEGDSSGEDDGES